MGEASTSGSRAGKQPAGDALPRPFNGWAAPSPFGAPSAVQSLSGTAAPLLAGFSVTLVALVLQAPEKFRFSGAMLTLLASGIVLLLTCVQCGFWARHYYSSPDEAVPWFDDYHESPERRAKVQDEQRRRYPTYRRWANAARLTYAAGIVCVYTALAAGVAPTEHSPAYGAKAAAALLLLVAAAGEVAWSVVAWWRDIMVLLRRS